MTPHKLEKCPKGLSMQHYNSKSQLEAFSKSWKKSKVASKLCAAKVKEQVFKLFVNLFQAWVYYKEKVLFSEMHRYQKRGRYR